MQAAAQIGGDPAAQPHTHPAAAHFESRYENPGRQKTRDEKREGAKGSAGRDYVIDDVLDQERRQKFGADSGCRRKGQKQRLHAIRSKQSRDTPQRVFRRFGRRNGRAHVHGQTSAIGSTVCCCGATRSRNAPAVFMSSSNVPDSHTVPWSSTSSR